MIVFPMAGLSSRFTRAGYDRPKWMLPLAGRPLLDWSLLGFSAMFATETFLLIHLDLPGVAAFVRARAEAIGIRHLRMVALPAPTRGQAETVMLGLARLAMPEAEPVTIFNIDTIRPGVRKDAFDGHAGWLECFEGPGDHWSFVRPGPEGRALQVTEKVRISSLCCSGLYHFGSAALFREAYAREEAAPGTAELYVAPMYQHMIAAGQDVRYGTVPPGRIFFSGTPVEYEALLADTAALQAAFPRL
ncbi:NTP transferase domain-containing protein [Roseomonas sp. E05]|uniref:NTP transferase domain-containing protein n=1 Tax=Roseomonas sp. E05 TaxID=3046310 RepID=UPI0024B9E866|nr:NTP transferase domain-containing protein [Roseomonas sp. E05]MDJ0390579.1 NTP transferase domain-containing protein [Roseomonas sp. E05]